MRRIIHNSTAIVACLSLMAPHLAMAQTAAPEASAQEQPAQTAGQPQAEAETQSDMACEDGSAPPCAATAPEAVAAPDQAGSAVAEQPEAGAEPAQTAAPEAVDAAAEPGIEQQETPVEALPADDGAAPADEAGAMPAVETEAAPLTEALAEQSEAQAEPVEETEQTPPEAAAETDADEPVQEQSSDTQPDAGTDEDALADALAEQAAEQEAVSPDVQPEGETGDQGGGQQAESQQPPEAAVPETEAAKEAAEASEAPTAVALGEGEGEVAEEQVTEENSRSSSEDFATSLSEALNAATGREAAEAVDASDGDDDNDLTKALLLGAGALAVGAMLNNNRQVTLSTPDRVVVTRPDGSQQIIKDEVALLRQPGSTVTTENFDDGSSRTIVTRADGSKVVTIRDADLRVLRRTLVSPDGSSVRLIDDSAGARPVDISSLPAPASAAGAAAGQMSEDQLRDALLRQSRVDRRFTLAQIRDIPQVRALVAPVNIDAITFDTGSAAIKPDQARQLQSLGNVIRDAIADNRQEMFLIEGHTDTVGPNAANLALSDRRAESVALALTEYFDVPPENMVVQGYGEQFLKVRQQGDVRENRRASVRRITDLIQQASN